MASDDEASNSTIWPALDNDKGSGSGVTRDYAEDVVWLPPRDPSKPVEEITPEQAIETSTMVLPVFPLGSQAGAYTRSLLSST